MKRVLSLLLVCTLILVLLSACGNDSGTVTMDKTELEMQVGDSYTFSIMESDKELSSDLFTWKSTDESVAMVVAGKVVALKDGESVIVATKDNHILSCSVKVGNGDEANSAKGTTTAATKLKTTAKSTITTTATTTASTTTTKVTECNHQYVTQTKYKCTLCGKIDETLAYDYFVEWITLNGRRENNTSNIFHTIKRGGYEHTIWFFYNHESQYTFCYSTLLPTDGTTEKSSILLQINAEGRADYCWYSRSHCTNGTDYIWLMVELDAANYTENTALTYYNYGSDTGESVTADDLEETRLGLNTVLYSIQDLLSGKYGTTSNSGLTLKNLGFASFNASISFG